jgi:hypothetical protein
MPNDNNKALRTNDTILNDNVIECKDLDIKYINHFK